MIGLDIIELSRMREIIDRTGTPFLDRIFTPDELILAEAGDKVRFLASAFAAKEAVFKAISQSTGLDELDFAQIEIGRDPEGRPTARILSIQETPTGKNIPDSVNISLSYETDLAIASAIVLPGSG